MLKEVKKNEPLYLVTHDGKFHYDEILAIAILAEIYPKFEIIRSRDPEIIAKGYIVLDVGGIFDPATLRFDHHQHGFEETFSPKFNIKLSSAGLIYKHFSELLFRKYGFTYKSNIYEEIREKMYKEFVLYADAIDNGYNIYSDIQPRTIASMIDNFNTNSYDSLKVQNSKFETALAIAHLDLKNYMRHLFHYYVPSYQSALQEMEFCNENIFINFRKYPVDLLIDVDIKLNKNIFYVIYMANGIFQARALPVKKGDFRCKKPFPVSWRGLRDEELVKACKVKGSIFVHANGFMCGNKTLNGITQMCLLTLEMIN